MGRGWGRVLLGREKGVACAVFFILFGVFQWAASNSDYIANSLVLLKKWPRESILGYPAVDKVHREVPENHMSDTVDTVIEDRNATPRVAICLVGGARAFELTGLSIKKYILDVYEHTDVFLHVPVDENTHKLTLLRDASKFAAARLFVPKHIPETRIQQEVLTGANSPNGIQGLLQYFSLVQGCLGMISWYEDKHGFKYDWIVRTRVDGYWKGPLLPLQSFSPHKYHIPFGSSFGGYNDRLGIGTRLTSWAALSRVSLIPRLHQLGYRNLNSENSFKAQLASENVTVELGEFPFCVLSSRKYAWPPDRWGVPVASIKSPGNLNGAKCRPCHAAARGAYAMQLLSVLDHAWGWMGPVHQGDVELCDSSKDEKPGLEQIFDEVSGPEFALARKKIKNRTRKECIQDIEEFGKMWELWDAPSAEELCSTVEK
ncbi:hypothetical protein R1flu_005412 [Riccia fluitans]|uniref:DUF7796 domain-containing protein n=1 Tax=Riccia fluitans TaxID=41844 RepID=A0ABD1YT37_9MARC